MPGSIHRISDARSAKTHSIIPQEEAHLQCRIEQRRYNYEKLWELVGSLLTTHTTSLHLTRSLMDLTIPLRREGILIMQLIMVLPPLRSKVSSMIMMTNSVV